MISLVRFICWKNPRKLAGLGALHDLNITGEIYDKEISGTNDDVILLFPFRSF